MSRRIVARSASSGLPAWSGEGRAMHASAQAWVDLVGRADQNPTTPRARATSSVVADTGVLPRFPTPAAGRPRRRQAVLGTGHRTGTYVAAPSGQQRDVVPDASAAPGSEPPNRMRPEDDRPLVQRHWEVPQEVAIPAGPGGDGGGNAILLMDIFRRDLRTGADPLDLAAAYVDGIRAAAVGLAANQSLATGLPVRADDLNLGVDP